MRSLTENQLLVALLAVAVILIVARLGGELARRLDQPEVIGELLGGFLLGPSIFGALAPELHKNLFLNGSVDYVLSGLSWIGAILLLLLAGMAIDLKILRSHAGSTALLAAATIIPSLAVGILFGRYVLNLSSGEFYLGIVLSVTAVSVASKILLERGEMRRGYAQVIVAVGVVTEVVVWLLVAAASAGHATPPLLAGLKSLGLALAFFLVVVMVGKHCTFWLMRKAGDASQILNGPATLVLVMTFLAAAGTQALGLHPLLGAFTVGVLLSQAPRATQQLSTGLQSLTFGLFGPIFFAIAGMRVDIFKLGNPSSLALIGGLFVAASATKVLFPMISARMTGRDWLQSTLIGTGVNLKGGTDVVVAVVGTELGLLSIRVYSMYTIVAVLTVLASPPVMSLLSKRAAIEPEERERLDKEEAEKRSYLPEIERVMVPVYEPLMPSLAAGVVEMIAQSKEKHEQILDITRFEVQEDGDEREYETAVVAKKRLEQAEAVQEVEVVRRKMPENDVLETIVKESSNYDLVAIGASPPEPDGPVSLGKLADGIIDQAESDALVAVGEGIDTISKDKPCCVLVPINGTDYSMAAADLAASIVENAQGEVVLFHVVPREAKELPAGQEQIESLVERSQGFMNDLEFRLSRMDVQVTQKITVADDVAEEIGQELEQGYDLIAIGGIDRGRDGQPYMGQTVRSIVCRSKVPLLLFARHAENGKKDEGLAI